MFSLEKFYFILYNNLLKPAKISDCYFYPFGSTRTEDLMFGINNPTIISKDHWCFYYDQEPINFDIAKNCINQHSPLNYPTSRIKLFANTEHSVVKDELCKLYNFKDWYYFFHGFAALDWYRDYQYVPKFENQITKIFISLNRLVTKDRSYRLYFVSQLLEKNLIDKGIISLILEDNGMGTWQEELTDPCTSLSNQAKILINQEIGKLTSSLVVDKHNPPGWASADVGPTELAMHKSALWQIVTETVFYADKLHLTEKIFKPIVAKRPFILVGATGNLEYLKSYGFKTFDSWIDESYDNETDPDIRIKLIVNELEKLCSLPLDKHLIVYQEMKEILDYNFNHFYGKFKEIIVKEMLDNFKNCIHDIPVEIDYHSVQKLLCQ